MTIFSYDYSENLDHKAENLERKACKKLGLGKAWFLKTIAVYLRKIIELPYVVSVRLLSASSRTHPADRY